MKKTIFIIIGWFIVFVLISSILIISSESFLINGTVILGWLLFMLQFTWNYSEFFYIKIKKLWFLIKNPDCVWDMSVEFKGNFNEQIFEGIDRALLDYTNDVDIQVLSNLRRGYRVKTFNFELVYDEHYEVFRFKLNKLELSYRRSRNILEQEANYLLEMLSKELKEDSAEYYFNISFQEFNPFYGFFLRRLNAREIQNFNVAFNVDNNKVSINKESIDIYTTSLQKLNQISKKYLTLSPR